MTDDEATLVTVGQTLVRIETKLDEVIRQGGDHEKRLRAVESSGFVSGKQLWAGMLGSCTVAMGVAALIGIFVH